MKNLGILIGIAAFLSIAANPVNAQNNQNQIINQNKIINNNQSALPQFTPELNRLNWVEVAEGNNCMQIMFDFSQPILFKKALNKEKQQLKLSFPGMKINQFDPEQVIPKISRLKALGIITDVKIEEKTKNYPRVCLTITFAIQKDLSADGQITTQKNSLLIKWSKMEDPNRLIFDIYTKEDLDHLKKKDSTILHAHSNILQTDYTQTNTLFTRVKPKETKPLRIIIDPGHGGADEGAKAYGFKEKDLTVDLGRKVRNLLSKDGYNVLLTRSSDQDISLVDRTEIAKQLKADLFISIHVNSAGKIGSPACGIETFYLSPNDFLPPTRHGGYIFINLEKNQKLMNTIDNATKENINQSKKLATCIQKSLINFLKKQDFDITNRGIKRARFLVLLRSPVPAALVEVGFITNPQEVTRLADKIYRQIIATGICKGIKDYIAVKS